LPSGFSYNVLGETGKRMSDGNITPADHDGMAAFADGAMVRLVRNHEAGAKPGKPLSSNATHSYDVTAPGGTTTLLIDPRTRELARDWVSLSGTTRNCAGGPTPWNTWISCEETVAGKTVVSKGTKREGGLGEEHGYCFEVSASADAPVRAMPLKAMGRFVHEAVAVDARTGIVYQTEDKGLPDSIVSCRRSVANLRRADACKC
jgi:secreted PhoX family phosphatase